MASTSGATLATTDTEQPVRQVPIKLRTSLAALSIADVPYLVPTTWRRSQLSTLVNRLLQQTGLDGTLDDVTGEAATAKAIPFDFIIDGQLLRSSLSTYLDSKGLTEESALDIEYVRSTLPPVFTASFEHDDWISAVDASLAGLFLTSSYDGTLRVFGSSTAEQALTTFQPSTTASLTDACWLRPCSSRRVAVAGMDGALRICTLPDLHSDDKGRQQAAPALESLSYTHAFETPSPLSSVRVNASGDTLATAAWDGCVAIWDTAVPSHVEIAASAAEEDRTSKRRKGSKGAALASATERVARKKPLTLLWHATPAPGVERSPNANGRVAGAVWSSDRDITSAGWDGGVKGWDVGEASNTHTKTSDKVILCLDVLRDQAQSIVTGHVDRSAALWDLRSPATNISLSFPNAHAAPIGVVRAHPVSSHLFASGAHDGTVKLWDTRSSRAALFSLVRPTAQGMAKKILALDWDPSGQTIIAGGEDCQLTVHRGHGIGREDLALAAAAAA